MGYESSDKNFIVADGKKKYYNRYAHWYTAGSNSYADWCAGFVSFCISYAKVENVPLSLACQAWTESLGNTGMYRAAKAYTPKAGDIIFFATEQKYPGIATHVGIVAEATEDTIRTIEGNRTRRVAYYEYAINDATILGYGEMPTKPETDENLSRQEIIEYAFTNPGNSIQLLKLLSANGTETQSIADETVTEGFVSIAPFGFSVRAIVIKPDATDVDYGRKANKSNMKE